MAAFSTSSSFDEAEGRKHTNAQMDKFIKEKGNPSIIYNKIVKVGKPWKCIMEMGGLRTLILIRKRICKKWV